MHRTLVRAMVPRQESTSPEDITSPVALPDSNPTSTVSSGTGTYSAEFSKGRAAIVAIVISFIVIVVVLLLAFFILRHCRAKHRNPKFIPTKSLKQLWVKWDVAPIGYHGPQGGDHLESIYGPDGTSRNLQSSYEAADHHRFEAINQGQIGRNASIRSVMTLPAYNQTARQNEQVLGREGERAGIDVVLEFPETVEVEEMRREEEMEALYQVRIARRRENEEREERRRLRIEAQERGDFVALSEIDARARATSASSVGQTVEELRAEHERLKKERQRTVSSVSYGDVGIARHDGTRIRANSQESECMGLLGDAASIAASSVHQRDRSVSPNPSVGNYSDLPSSRYPHSRPHSGTDIERRVSDHIERYESRAGSSPEMISHEDFHLHSPPGYENLSRDPPRDRSASPPGSPPGYTNPTMSRGKRYPGLEYDIPVPDAPGNRRNWSQHRNIRHSRSGISQPRDRSAQSGTCPDLPGMGEPLQLPSFTSEGLPSIHVDPATPCVELEAEEIYGRAGP